MYRLTTLAAFLILPTMASAQTPSDCPPPSARGSDRVERANTALVRRFHDAINRQDWALADRLVGPDYRHHVTGPDGFRAVGWDAFKRGNRHLRTAFPDWSNAFLQIIAEGDRVAVVLQGRGTHRGSVAGERPTGRSATLPIMIVHQICRGRIVADWEMVNTGPLMETLRTP